MTTDREDTTAIGHTYELPVRPGVTMTVRAVDSRRAYGKRQLLVIPLAGTGQCWVDDISLRPTTGAQEDRS
jgi:hypothetical protein